MPTPNLTTIPPEILLSILEMLRGIDVENVAKTFNRAITPACLPLIQFRVDHRRDRKAMAALFGGDGYPIIYDPEEAYGKLGLEKEWGPFVDIPNREGRVVLDYFDFDGTLHWMDLGPYDLSGSTEKTRERVGQLDRAAKLCGFALPEAFRTTSLYPNDHLISAFGGAHAGGQEIRFEDRMFRRVRWLKKFQMSGNDNENAKANARVKDPSVKRDLAQRLEDTHGPDEFAEGYLITFVGDQQGCGYTHLFIDPKDERGRSRTALLSSAGDVCDGYTDEYFDNEEGELEPDEYQALNIARVRQTNASKRPTDQIAIMGGEWIHISVTEEMAEMNIWPILDCSSFELMINCCSLDEFIAAHWLEWMGFAVRDMPSKSEGDSESENEGDSESESDDGRFSPRGTYIEPLRQHLIDIYSTKGRKTGWLQKFEPIAKP